MSLYGKEDTIDRVSEGLGHSLASRIPELQQQKSVKSSGNADKTAAHEAQAKGNNISCSGPQSQGRGGECIQPARAHVLHHENLIIDLCVEGLHQSQNLECEGGPNKEQSTINHQKHLTGRVSAVLPRL